MKVESNPRVTYRISTVDDIENFTGKKPESSMRSISFFLDGELSGIGGYKIENGNFVVFSDIKENVIVSKQTIWRCAKIVMDMIEEKGLPMYALSHNKKFVEKLGFKQFKDEVFVWGRK